MGNQCSSLEVDSTEWPFQNLQKIKKKQKYSKYSTRKLWLGNRAALSSNDVNLSTELFIKKLENLINFCVPLQRVLNKQKKLFKKPRLTSDIPKSNEIKHRLHKRMCRAKDPLNEEELGGKVKY